MVSKVLKYSNIDWWLVFLTTLMTGGGCLLIFTATTNNQFWIKQIVFYCLSLWILLIISLIKPSFWFKMSLYFYFIGIFFLLLVLTISSGSVDRWIPLPLGLHLQPSEVIKISLILVLARVLSSNPVRFSSFKSFILPTILFLIPFILVLKQPDLSSAVVLMMIFLSMIYFSQLDFKQILVLSSPFFSILFIFNQWFWIPFFVLSFFLMWYCRMRLYSIIIFLILNIVSSYSSLTMWNHLLKPYQKKRIFSFLNPLHDPYGQGYQIIQSKITIGSGGLFGKGLGKGSQINLGFLPEQHTDFIFAVLAEQFGFIGSMCLLLLFVAFNYRILKIFENIVNPFSALIIVGLLTFFIFHMFFNIGMTLGLIPVIGLPLPFVSYGGSFLLTCLVGVALIFSVNQRT